MTRSNARKAIVIGAGFSGLASAAHLARKGFDVTVLEKHAQAGGRARTLSDRGFRFDMGPSWYWMPDVFERFFAHFGHKAQDFYSLTRLSPSYRIYFENNQLLDIPSDFGDYRDMFERLEPGSSKNLDLFLHEAAYKYQVGINDLVYKPGRSISEFMDMRIVTGLFRLQMLTSLHSHVRKLFSDSRLRRLLEFPVLFLGAHPKNIPALYSLMNYADIMLGTWYPTGGMHSVVEAMLRVNEECGVKVHLNSEVTGVEMSSQSIRAVHTRDASYAADVIVASADYHHVENALLPEQYRQYSESYWNSRTMAPSALMYYLGINKRVENVLHHTLFFDRDFDVHAQEIYSDPKFPTDPLFYLSVASKTDPTVAPEGCENVFILIPTAPGVSDTPEVREKYYQMVMQRLEQRTGQSLREHVVVRHDFAHNDFVREYHSFKGNAYGLANTLRQTAILKPRMKSSKVKNLYYAGQLTVPGPGVPPSLISGEVVANEIHKDLR
jgi:phytoene desaturase